MLVRYRDCCLYRKKFDGAWRAESRRTDSSRQTGHLWPAHGKLCDACANARCKESAIQVLDVDELEPAVEKLLPDDEARRLLVQSAEKALAPHRGATARTAQLIVDLG